MAGARRPVVIAARFTEAEARDFDERRGALSRADFLRWLWVQARKNDTRFGLPVTGVKVPGAEG